MTQTRERSLALLVSSLLAVALLFAGKPAHAQSIIKRPGDHPNYGVELEPHILGQYDRTPYTDGGFGLGFRATIPFMHNGPVPQINNNIGISFGADVVWFGDDHLCNGRGYTEFFVDSCSARDLWLPVTGQWNFFLTPIISVFGEFGLSIHHTHYGYEGQCNGQPCDAHYNHLDFFEPVVWAGGRFLFGKTVGLTVRLGWPYISVGASFLL
ncbi:MAG TPA: hypothetical protein VGQ57_16010 [Polyangiaceae bacterium]|jgi:hypothetical protein|nr:hypothetical protein [Polyangiaceae bacterium]